MMKGRLQLLKRVVYVGLKGLSTLAKKKYPVLKGGGRSIKREEDMRKKV